MGEREDGTNIGENVEEAVEGQPKRKGKFKILIIVIIIALMAGMVGAYLSFGERILTTFKGQPQNKGLPKAEETKRGDVGPILSLEPFLFNVADNPSRFARLSISIELKDKKAAEEAKRLTPLLRDKILFVLSRKEANVLMDVNGREDIKQELFATLTSLFPKGDIIKNVYITDIVIQ